ncbi:MAG: tetratricopeptide repeat protein [Planctomycetota bacterium]
MPGNQYASVIYIPNDYKDGLKLPLIFFMHGAGGKPNTWLFQEATGGEGYIVVGLAYGGVADSGANGIRSDPAICAAMIQYIAQVREIVKKTYGFNEQQVFLAGFSMGGWGVNYYGFNKKAQGLYRGYCILAAGPMRQDEVDFSVAKGLPVLLLNGEKDANIEVANKGKPALEKAGAIVKQVIIPGAGHVPKAENTHVLLKEWLKEWGPLKAVLELLKKAQDMEKTSLGKAMTLYEEAFALGSVVLTDPEVKSAHERLDALLAQTKQEWDAAMTLIDQKRYYDAIALIEKFAAQYKGHRLAQEAEKKIVELKNNEEVKKYLAIGAAQKSKDEAASAAEQLLARALEQLQAKDYPKASDILKQVVALYPGTPSAEKATIQLKAFMDDPKIVTALKAVEMNAECRKWLSSAKNYRANGMQTEALALLDQIIQKYPQSDWEREALSLKMEIKP